MSSRPSLTRSRSVAAATVRDGAISQFAYRKLRQLIRTPLLQTEQVWALEPHIDFVIADATDFVRGNIGYHGMLESLGVDIELHGPGPAIE